jgi:hypothetical protein
VIRAESLYLYKNHIKNDIGQTKSLNIEKYNSGKLFVKTYPKNAIIRILNIKAKFYQGISLQPSSYNIEVSAEGWTTSKLWINLNAGQNQDIYVRLERNNKLFSKCFGKGIKLRSEPKTLTWDDIHYIKNKYKFNDCGNNRKDKFVNFFYDNNNGTITDCSTELIWQKSCSNILVNYEESKKYISELNRKQFAGLNNWRIPTIEELLSLLENKKIQGLFIDPLFNSTQTKCWSSDIIESEATIFNIEFDSCFLGWHRRIKSKLYIRAVCDGRKLIN